MFTVPNLLYGRVPMDENNFKWFEYTDLSNKVTHKLPFNKYFQTPPSSPPTTKPCVARSEKWCLPHPVHTTVPGEILWVRQESVHLVLRRSILQSSVHARRARR